jgi:hypothetical protein
MYGVIPPTFLRFRSNQKLTVVRALISVSIADVAPISGGVFLLPD